MIVPAAMLLLAMLLFVGACSHGPAKKHNPPKQKTEIREETTSPPTTSLETTGDSPPEVTLGDDPDGKPEVVIRLEGDPDGETSGAQKGMREIYLPEADGFKEVPVYDRYRLEPGAELEGPAVVEEREATVILGPEGRSEIDAARSLISRWR